tara:strand:+ start:4758 stop:5423 length:666 start_codon:yes stop_codon:yes gene_type:complete
MRHFDTGYFKKKISKRKFISKKRDITNRIIAWGLDKEYYDGKRINGYGGYKYDGRWKKFLPKIIKRYKLTKNSKVLDLGCKKGFFMKDLKDLVPGIKIYGIEDHEYAIKKAHPEVKKNIKYSEYYNLPFKNKEIDFIFAFNSIYTHNLRHTVNSLREMQRVGKKNYVVVASYENEKEKNAFLDWTVIGTTVLSKKEWLKLFRFIGYKGDYYFSTAKTLGLI